MKGDYRGLFVGEQQTFGFEFLSFFILYNSLSHNLSFFAREKESFLLYPPRFSLTQSIPSQGTPAAFV